MHVARVHVFTCFLNTKAYPWFVAIEGLGISFQYLFWAWLWLGLRGGVAWGWWVGGEVSGLTLNP